LRASATREGRRRPAQGGERRAAILEATVRVLVRNGLAGVTHRAVAREAGVPLAATTYYFSSKEELLAEALALMVDDEISRLGRRAAEMGEGLSSPADSAAALAEVLLPDADAARALLAKFEVYLEAGRRPSLREPAAHWQDALADLATMTLAAGGATDPERLAPVIIAGIDGIIVHELSRGITGDGDVARLRSKLEQLFELVLPGS
jgi:TetR/AcrR family transcriptional regulator, regulator of biofilm formation and stress response